MRTMLVEGLMGQGVSSSQVLVQSVGEGELSLLATGVIVSFRVEADTANVDTVRSELESYVNNASGYSSSLKALGGIFANVGTMEKSDE